MEGYGLALGTHGVHNELRVDTVRINQVHDNTLNFDLLPSVLRNAVIHTTRFRTIQLNGNAFSYSPIVAGIGHRYIIGIDDIDDNGVAGGFAVIICHGQGKGQRGAIRANHRYIKGGLICIRI